MKGGGSATEFASRRSRALIAASNYTKPTRSWSPSLKNTLHRLRCRNSLTPSLVARVIDPFLLHHSLALGFFNWAAQQPGFSHTFITYQSILKSLSCSPQFNAIDALLKQVKTQKVTLHYSIYGSIKFRPKICNSLLATLVFAGYFELAQKVFDEMSQKGVLFTTLGFGVFIWRYVRKLNWVLF
ncbi:hypothetical protein G4B88_028711 [Cannabis sativa]|uniref:Pentatricopeptide repeat-containing protein n=1 Tax=Cannabis sativa TaxID=3483 RepID=A0A7J6EQN1_CANSA|nr:hypothetical protein G4B88_031237 [Cannabis sativa]KAF4359960.1 hypothetical protein G4B88_028711 [Cannabis sativa]